MIVASILSFFLSVALMMRGYINLGAAIFVVGYLLAECAGVRRK